MNKPVLAGIDVSADLLSVALEADGKATRVVTFENTPSGHQKVCRALTARDRTARVCLEATGIYSLDLALALHGAKGIEVMVANPRATKDFARAFMQRAKTDATDALAILEFLKRMPFTPWTPPPPALLDLRAISRRITALTTTRSQERNRLHAADRCAHLTEVLREDTEAHIAYLEQSLARLTEQAVRLVTSSPSLRVKFDHLVSVTGIATASAIRILAELAVLPDDMTARQWVAHAGLDPRPYQSGTSTHKRVRISKTGNKHLRAALYMPALVAIQYEPNVRAFYGKLLANDKKPMQATIAVMRKLLHALYGMFRHNRDFQGQKFYAIPT